MKETDEMFVRYIRDIKAYPLITPIREQQLSDIIHSDSASKQAKLNAKNELVLGNLRLVVKIAGDIFNRLHSLPDMNMSLMDLIQAGNLGLLRAADLFLSSAGTKFVTYAHLTIERKIMRAIKESRFIRLPPDHFRYLHQIELMEDENKGGLTDSEMAEKLNIQTKTLKLIKRNRYSKVSVEDLSELLDRFDTEETPFDDIIGRQHMREYVFLKIKELKPRHREVLLYMFFSNKPMTLKDVGQKIGVTREAVRLIIAKAIHILKRKIEEDLMMKRMTKNKKTVKG